MRFHKKTVLILLLALAAFALPAAAQQQISSGAVQITGNGNTAYVNANNALQVELHNGASTIGITGTSLNVNVTNGSSGGTSATDEAAFTLGTTPFTPAGCYYQTTVTTGALTTGEAGIPQCDADRRLFVVGAGTAGTAAGGVMTVQGASSMTPLEVSPTTAANSLSNQFFVQLSDGTHGNTFNSSTYTSKYGADVNILGLDGALLSATNPLFNELTDGTNAMGAMANYGSAPGAVKALNANVAVTNNPVLGAGTALVGKTVPLTACGTTNYDAAFQALPTSPTALTASTTCVENMVFCNTSTSTAYTVTITDDQGSPVTAINATSIPPSSCFNYPFNWTEFTSGIKWSASNASVTGAVHGVQ